MGVSAETIAAIYARKGWTVLDEHVYVDNAISGAEFERRPGFVRLMAALKPRAPFQVLVMSEESRLGREAIETAYALKQLSRRKGVLLPRGPRADARLPHRQDHAVAGDVCRRARARAGAAAHV
jgi:DNA invertase Pin-like site-specific DNA recombinase